MLVFSRPTLSSGVSYLLLKPQYMFEGVSTPFIGGTYNNLAIHPIWAISYNPDSGSYYFNNNSRWESGFDVIYSDTNIYNSSGVVVHPADFGLGSLEPTSVDGTTEYPSDFIGPIPPSNYYKPILDAGEDEEGLTVQHEWLSEAVSNVESWQEDLDEYITGIDEAASNVADYLDSGSTVLSSFLSAAPTAVVAFVTFGLAFLVIRKVIGR